MVETSELVNSKLADKDSATSFFLKKDNFSKTLHNIDKCNSNNNFYQKLEKILDFFRIDEQIKKDVIDLDYHDQERLRLKEKEKLIVKT